VDMPPVLVLEPTPLEAVAVAPGKLLVFDEALALVEPVGVVAEVVLFMPVPMVLPAAPVVAPTPALPVPPTPAAKAGKAIRTAPHNSADPHVLIRVLFMVFS
jgi:hypothetical protein